MTDPRLAGGILPETGDIDTAGFWDAAREGRLVARMCATCGAVLHLPRAYCSECGRWEGRWEELPGSGRLHSWTVVHHQVHPAYPVPYTIVLVDVDGVEGVRLLGRIDGECDLRADQPMHVWFEEVAEDVFLPQWRPSVVEG